MVREKKIFAAHRPKTDSCPGGKADTGNPGFANIVGTKLGTEKIYRDMFGQVARLLPNGYIGGYYVVHYSKIYGEHKLVETKKRRTS